MSRHVRQLLAAYIDGQLSPGDAARVSRHLLVCRECQDRLSAHQRLSDDLRLALSAAPRATGNDVNRWWGRIAEARVAPPATPHVRILAPALVLILALGLPLLAGLTGTGPRPASAHEPNGDITASVPATSYMVVGMIPQPEELDHTTTVIATAAPQENAATPAPAPLAPSAQ